MQLLFFLLILLQQAATGKTETRCTVANEEKLLCSFPQDVNKTQIDFGVYFYPDSGGEEPLVNCGWTNLSFHCNRQKGFEYHKPVSDIVVVSVPSSFAEKRGHYKCIPHGDSHKTARPCRYPAVEDKRKFAACEASSTLDGLSLAVKCTFSFQVDSFHVLQNDSTLAKYFKSSCQHSRLCHYMPLNNTDIFSVNLNVSVHPNDKIICLPETLFITLKTCNISTKVESSPACTVVARLPFVVSLALLSTVIYFGQHYWPQYL